MWFEDADGAGSPDVSQVYAHAPPRFDAASIPVWLPSSAGAGLGSSFLNGPAAVAAAGGAGGGGHAHMNSSVPRTDPVYAADWLSSTPLQTIDEEGLAISEDELASAFLAQPPSILQPEHANRLRNVAHHHADRRKERKAGQTAAERRVFQQQRIKESLTTIRPKLLDAFLVCYIRTDTKLENFKALAEQVFAAPAVTVEAHQREALRIYTQELHTAIHNAKRGVQHHPTSDTTMERLRLHVSILAHTNATLLQEKKETIQPLAITPTRHFVETLPADFETRRPPPSEYRFYHDVHLKGGDGKPRRYWIQERDLYASVLGQQRGWGTGGGGSSPSEAVNGMRFAPSPFLPCGMSSCGTPSDFGSIRGGARGGFPHSHTDDSIGGGLGGFYSQSGGGGGVGGHGPGAATPATTSPSCDPHDAANHGDAKDSDDSRRPPPKPLPPGVTGLTPLDPKALGLASSQTWRSGGLLVSPLTTTTGVSGFGDRLGMTAGSGVGGGGLMYGSPASADDDAGPHGDPHGTMYDFHVLCSSSGHAAKKKTHPIPLSLIVKHAWARHGVREMVVLEDALGFKQFLSVSIPRETRSAALPYCQTGLVLDHGYYVIPALGKLRRALVDKGGLNEVDVFGFTTRYQRVPPVNWAAVIDSDLTACDARTIATLMLQLVNSIPSGGCLGAMYEGLPQQELSPSDPLGYLLRPSLSIADQQLALWALDLLSDILANGAKNGAKPRLLSLAWSPFAFTFPEDATFPDMVSLHQQASQMFNLLLTHYYKDVYTPK